MTGGAARDLAYQIFCEAMELQGGSREQFVTDKCRADAALRDEVEALLTVAANQSLDTASLRGTVWMPSEPSLTGRVFGRFRLEEPIGEGGMGVVYRAERNDGVQQSVALKLMSSTLEAAAQHRFRREAQLLARLEHPSIARLIDAGIDEGRAWIAIEFVRGERIDRYCANHALSPRDIVRLLIRLTDAVAAAHRMLVVHSDIKPANVLVTPEGMPKLVDFGISTALRDAGALDLPTVSVNRLFSPNYAAPEQVHGGPLTVGTDVFGLGALAYRLLTGCPTYADAGTPIAYLLALSQRDVDTASRAAAQAGRPDAIVKALRGDLDAILSKALNRDPARRYATTAAMQDDLQHYLDRRPVVARAPSMAYRLGRFLRRNALVASLCALLCISILAGGVFAAVTARRAEVARQMAERRGEFLENLLMSADPRHGRRDISVGELLDAATASLHDRFVGEPLVEASMLGLIADTYDGLGRYAEGLAASKRQLALLDANGGNLLERARALTSQGEVLREQGRWGEAEPVMRAAVALLRSEDHPAELAAALDLLGIVLMRNRQQDEAEAILRQEIDLESMGGPALQDRRAYPYFALAAMFVDLGRYPEALNASRKSLEIARRALPPDHPDLLAFEAEYASALLNDHDAALAEPLLRDIVARDIRVSGPDHKDTAMHATLLADSLLELHRDAEAGDIAANAARTLEPLLGSDNTYTLAAWQAYGAATCRSNGEAAGLAVLRRIEAAWRRLYPPADHRVHMAALATASCLIRLQRYSDAEAGLLIASAGLETARGPRFRYTQAAYGRLRDLYAATNRPDEAAAFAAKLAP